MATIIEHVEGLLRDRIRSGGESSCDPILSILAVIGRAMTNIASAAPSEGYEPWLRTKGWDVISARGMAMLIRRHAERVTKEEEQEIKARRALRELVKPQLGRRSKRRRVAELLRIAEETCVFDAMLHPHGQEAFELVTFLKAEEDRLAGCDPRLLEMIRLVLSKPAKRGIKRSVPSVAHEFLLRNLPPELRGAAYCYHQATNSCSDAASEATRQEFGLARFDARPAARRLSAS